MTPSAHTLILASAGAGKTHRLTTRYLALLVRGVAPSAVLATTFTRKAAGEILGRTLSRLLEATADDKARAKLEEQLRADLPASPMEPLTRERCAALALGFVRSMHRAGVMTIDAFFGRVASALTLDLGAPPGWSILSEEDDALLRARAVDDALGATDSREMTAIFERYYAGGAGRFVHTALLECARSAHGAYRATRDRPEVWGGEPPGAAQLTPDSLAAAIEAIARLQAPLKKTGEEYKPYRKTLDTSCASARDGDWKSLLSAGLGAKLLAGETTFSRIPIPPDHAEAYAPLIAHASGALLRDHAERARAAFALMSRFDDAYTLAKFESGSFTFDDIPRLIASLADRLPDLYYRLDASVHHLLLDEFQDTSLDQFELLRPILEELASQERAERSLFCVGDVKQSLYGWRGAEPELLPALPGLFPSLAKETAAKSYRSSQIVLDAVNAVFGALDANSALDDQRDAAIQWSEGFERHDAANDLPGEVRLIVGPEGRRAAAGRVDRADQTHRTLDLAVDRIAQIVAGAPGASIGVLLRRNKHTPQLIEMLAKKHIRASGERGNPLTDAPPAAVAVSLLHFADHPGDTACRFHVAHSPLGEAIGLPKNDDDARARRIASDLRRRFADEGYATVLADLFRECAPSMDARGESRVEQLLDLARSFDAGPARRPADLARLIRLRPIDDPSARGVRVMTIHRAKGLEFDAVVLPDLGSPWKLHNDEMLIDRPSLFEPPTRVAWRPSALLQSLDPELGAMHTRALARKTREELSALYVAMTRAKFSLDMFIPPDALSGSTLTAARVLAIAFSPGSTRLTPEQSLHHSGNAEWMEARPEDRPAAPPSASEPETTLRFAPTGARPASRRAVRTPSSLARPALVDLAQTLRPPATRALDAGELLHLWFERVEWSESAPLSDAALLDAARALPIEERETRALLPRFRAALGAPAVRDALSREGALARLGPAALVEARCEVSFAVADSDSDSGGGGGGRGGGGGDRPGILLGRIDRLVVALSTQGEPLRAEVVDFKTDAPVGDPAQFCKERAERYAPQLRAYRRAAATILGLDLSRVGARVLFTGPGAVIDVTC